MRDKAAIPAALRRRWQGSLSEGAVSRRLTEGVTLSEGAVSRRLTEGVTLSEGAVGAG